MERTEMSLLKSIVFGIACFIVVGLGFGIGTFLSIVTLDSSTSLVMGMFSLVGSLLFIVIAPILALFTGMIQGRTSKNTISAILSGGISGMVGYMLLMFIVIGLMAAAMGIKYPPGTTTSTTDFYYSNVDWGLVLYGMAIFFLPAGFIGAGTSFLAYFFLRPAPVGYFPDTPTGYAPNAYGHPQQPMGSPYPQPRPPHASPVPMAVAPRPSTQNRNQYQSPGQSLSPNRSQSPSPSLSPNRSQSPQAPETTLGKPLPSITCPECNTEFRFNPEHRSITCPNCGMKGSASKE